LLDVYVPKGMRGGPALLYLHGGAFALLSKETHRLMALAFARRGYTVFLANYRIGPRHRYPAPLEDAVNALGWVLDHARDYGADPSRIILAGESAGGNLVTALSYMATHPRPEPFARQLFERNPPIIAVLAVYGFLDLEQLERFRNPNMPWYIRRMIVDAAAAYVGRPVKLRARLSPLASPLRLLSEDPHPGSRPLPPFFIACGTRDPLLVDSRKLHAVLDARGVPNELSIHPEEIHGFNAMLWRREARAMWRSVYDFLDRVAPARRARGAA
jgi:acetyl esterase